jgi:hypothetical protein
MNELAQAPASGHDTTTDTSQTRPAGDQRPASYDGADQHQGTAAAADADPAWYDGDIQAALAADDAPTRQEAARLDTAGDSYASPGHDASPRSDADIRTILHEDDDLPDPRTRQQAAADDLARTVSASDNTTPAPHNDPADAHDADIEAILHEDDHQPDPRTRQQAAREDARGGATTDKNNAPASDLEPRSGPDPSTPDAAALPEHSADNTAENPSADPDRRERQEQNQGDRPNSRVAVLKADAADRTLGDTTPTGIGLKPTGEQLFQMEPDKPAESRADRLFGKAFEMMDDVHDMTGHIAEAIQEDLPRGAGSPPSGHSAYVIRDQPASPPDAPGFGDAVGNITVIGVMTVVGFRRLLGHRKRGQRA